MAPPAGGGGRHGYGQSGVSADAVLLSSTVIRPMRTGTSWKRLDMAVPVRMRGRARKRSRQRERRWHAGCLNLIVVGTRGGGYTRGLRLLAHLVLNEQVC